MQSMANFNFNFFRKMNLFLILLLLLIIILNNVLFFAKDTKEQQPVPDEFDYVEIQYLLFLSEEELTEVKRNKMAINLASIQFHYSSKFKFNKLEEIIDKKGFPKKLLTDYHAEYASFLKQILEKKFGHDDNSGLKLMCRMWEMEKRLDLFIIQPALLISSLSFMNFNICDKLDGVSWADKRKWPPEFMKDMSGKFADFFDMAFSIGTAKWSQSMKEWFSEKRMPGEGALMHWMRMNGVDGKVRELGEAKLRMIRHLMLEEDLALLESKWPLIMAFDVIGKGRLKLIFTRMFDPNANSMGVKKIGHHLKSVFLFGKIFAYFCEWSKGEKYEESYEKLWKIFVNNLSDLNKNSNEKQLNFIKMMENLLNYLRNQSPQISADAQRNSKELLANCVNQFLLLCESNAEFFENFRELSKSRAVFKEILDFASKGMEEMLPNRLMNWFNDHNKNQKDLENFGVGRSFADRIFEKSNIKKSYDECPKENMTNKELIRADQKAQSNDPEAYYLMTSYIDFLQTSADDRFHGTSVASIDLVAAIWHFRETIRNLFRFGDSLEDKSDKFSEILAKNKQFFEEDTSEIRDENRELCQLNKIGHKIVHLGELRDGSKAWRERMERGTKTNTGDMFEERFLFLPNGDEEIAIFGDEMDCQNAETLSRLKSQMFGVQRKKRIHFFCLNKLIKRFKRLQSFFCYGIGEFQPLLLKDNVRLLISEQALDALEAKNPEILHYDILIMGIFTATFVAQLRHKSGSPIAECYEVRILLSSLMARINLLERSLYEYNDNLPAPTRKACLEKIVRAKNEFYAKITEGNLSHLRKTFCVMYQFAKFLEKSVAVGRLGEAIERWEATECQNENVVKETILAHRAQKKRTIFDIIISAVKKEEVMRQLREIRGCYTRISRYLEDQRMFKKLLKEADFYEQRVFEKDRLMQAHYIEVLLCVDLAINGEGWLKADLMVFVRWMDSKKFAKDAQNELMANRIGKVWDNEIRPIFAKTYDSFYDLDDSPENHAFKIKNLRKILSIFKNYLDKIINAKKAKSDRVVFAELAKIIGSGGDSLPANGKETINDINGMPMALSETQEKSWHCFENWIQNLHFDVLKQMLNKQTIFFDNIKRFFESKPKEHTDKLMLFLHNKQNVENILRLLGIDFEANGSSDGDPTERTPGAEDDDWPSTDSPMGSTASPVVSPSTERKKAKRKKAKRSKNQRKTSIVEHEIDEEMFLSSETPKNGTESQKKQSEEEEKPSEQEEDEAVIEAAEIEELIGEEPSKHEAANGGKAQEKDEAKIEEEPTAERAPDKEEDEEEEAVNEENGPKEDEEEETVETGELIREGPSKEEAVKGAKAPAKHEAKNGEEPTGSAPDEEEEEEAVIEEKGAKEEEAVKEALEGEKLTGDKKAPKDKVDIGKKAFEGKAVIVKEPMEKEPLKNEAEKAENEKMPEHLLAIASVQKAEREMDVMEETINRNEEHIDYHLNYQSKNHNWEDVQIGDDFGSEKGNSMALSKSPAKGSKSPQKGAKGQTKDAASANFEFCHEHFNANNLDIAEIKGISIDYFGDNELLMIKYGELIWYFVCSQTKTTAINNSKVIGQNKKVENEQKPMPKESVTVPGEDASVRAIVHLLDLGIYANEIWHRLNAIRLVEQIWPELGILQSEVAKIEGQWAKIKGIKLSLKSQWTELEKYLHQMLKQLLVLMDKKKFPGINYDGVANDNEGELLREIRLLKDEMHLRNLAFSLAESKSAQTIWHSLCPAQSASFLSLLFSHLFRKHLHQRVNFAMKENNQQKIDVKLYYEFRNNKNLKRFVPFKMSANFATKKLNQISELWQHMAFGEDRFNELDIYNLKNEIAKGNNYLIFDVNQKAMVENIIREMDELLKNWSSKINCHFSDEWLFRPKEEAKLSAICIMPFEFDISSFLGTYFSSNSSVCHDQSLFCRLSKKENLLALQRIQKDYFNSVPQIHFTYQTLPVTIMAILVPNHGQEVPNGPLDDQKIKTIAQKFGDEIEKLIRADHLFDEGQFRISQKVNDQTMEQLANSIVHAVPKEAAKIMHQWVMFDQLKDLLLKDRQKAMNLRESVKTHLAMIKAFANFTTHAKIHWFLLDKLDTTQKEAASTVLNRNINNHNNLFINFAFLLAYLEQWAKSNHINGEHIGFLNFNILVVMVTKIVLAHSNAALPILIEKFFITYSTWPWPLPVQLTEICVHRKGEFLSWMPGREWFTKRQHSPKKMLKAIHAELAMAIITPTFPERNLAQNSNISALKCIQNQMNKALKTLRNESEKNALIGPLINKTFSQMYEHFIVVICAAPNYQIETFANLVGIRIGHELPEIIENPLERWIKFCHLFARPISLGECNNNNNNAPSPKSSSTYCKKIWLVGIEVNEKQKELSKFQDKMREKLKKKLAKKIISNFEGSFVEIETDYVNEREQLQKLWGIDLNLI